MVTNGCALETLLAPPFLLVADSQRMVVAAEFLFLTDKIDFKDTPFGCGKYFCL
jgi:hypothetical protein